MEHVNTARDSLTGSEIIDRCSLKKCCTALKNQGDYYIEKNKKMEETLKKLNLTYEDLNNQSQINLNELVRLQETHKSTKCTTESIALSYADRQYEQYNYVTKVQGCIKAYSELIIKLNKEIQIAQVEYKKTEKVISSLSIVDVTALELKVEKSEKELLKFEKNYPWLKDSQWHLQNISKEIDILVSLKAEKENLQKDLLYYQNLKPSITEATEQLSALKQQYESLK